MVEARSKFATLENSGLRSEVKAFSSHKRSTEPKEWPRFPYFVFLSPRHTAILDSGSVLGVNRAAHGQRNKF